MILEVFFLFSYINVDTLKSNSYSRVQRKRRQMHGITWSALRQKFVQMYAAFASRFVFSFLRVATQVNALNFSEPDR